MAREQKLDLKMQEASKEVKQDVESNTGNANKEAKESVKESKAKDLESLLKSLSPQEAKVLRNFMNSSVYDTFITYLENILLEKEQIIHRINCYCFRAKEDLSVRIYGKIYQIEKNEIIYIQKDSFGNSMLRNNKLERII